MRFLFWLVSGGLFVGIAGLIGFFAVMQHYQQGLPDVAQLRFYNPPVLSRVHGGDGRLMAEFAAERRVFVPIGLIPQRVVDAFLAAEDKSFYQHNGIDPEGIIGAVLRYVRGGDRLAGASTITQQVAKNMLLSNERSFERKIREALLAFRIEAAFTKDEILELYLNEIFLGQRAYGVGAAAMAYFSKSLDELTIAEAAYLAALPKAPNNYHPVEDREAAYDRRNWVLGQMLANGFITEVQLAAARSEEIKMRPRDENEIFRGAEYAVEEIRRQLVSLYGEEKALGGGMLVRSTIDPRLQEIATRTLRQGLLSYDRRHGWRGPVAKLTPGSNYPEALAKMTSPAGGEMWQLAAITGLNAKAAQFVLANGEKGELTLAELGWARLVLPRGGLGPSVNRPSDILAVGDVVLVERDTEGLFRLRQVPKVQGALVALDPHTGRILAMEGGFSYRLSVFNRATQAQRQPGSAFKPFVYLAALEAGMTPSSLVLDAPISLPQGPGLPEWRPENYNNDYLGPTTLRVGMEKSRNIMTVRLATQLGIQRIAETVERFGIMEKMPRNYSMVLGAGETTALKLTAAYAEIVNGGRAIAPTLIDSIQDKNGKIIFRHDTRPCEGCRNILWKAGLGVPPLPDTRAQVADPAAAYQMVQILEGVVQRGTGARARGLPWPVAGKTGTTNDAKDNWFVGFSPNLAVGMYIGFDNPVSLGEKETGGANVAPMFRAFMEAALQNTPPIPFRAPPGLRLVRVNPATGQLAAPGEEGTIWEAFKPGTEPQRGGFGGLENEPDLPAPSPPADMGGLY